MVDFSLLANIMPIQYPTLDFGYRQDSELVERVQVKFGDDRFAILVRHPEFDHWCGYVQIDPRVWDHIVVAQRELITPRVSYMGYSGKYIGWMTRTERGRLTVPTTVAPMIDDGNGDFWVGFDTNRTSWFQGDMIGYKDVYEVLIGFENFIWRMRNGYLSA